MFDKLLGEEGKQLDSEVRSQIFTAIKGLDGLIDGTFYGIEEHLRDKKPEPEPVADTQSAVHEANE